MCVGGVYVWGGLVYVCLEACVVCGGLCMGVWGGLCMCAGIVYMHGGLCMCGGLVYVSDGLLYVWVGVFVYVCGGSFCMWGDLCMSVYVSERETDRQTEKVSVKYKLGMVHFTYLAIILLFTCKHLPLWNFSLCSHMNKISQLSQIFMYCVGLM